MKPRSGALLLIVILFALLLPVPAQNGQATSFLWIAAQAADYDCNTQSDLPVAECNVLVTLYNSTNGDAWTDNSGWLANTTPCTNWLGIICDSGHLVAISLPQNGLVGTLPAELGNLTTLKSLSLYTNQIGGVIPTSLGNLGALEYLNLGGNQLTGTIPTEFGNLSNLTDLWLNSNQLSGTIPTGLGNLANLKNIILYSNQLSGGIPTQLGNLTNLQTLWLATNQLTGNIPTQLGNLTSLTELHLAQNQLTGNIPSELGNLTNLTLLILSNNQLTGNIPTQLGNLTQLDELSLHHNQLTGSIPTQLGNLSQLTLLYLSDNQLTGSIPTQLGDLSNLVGLQLSTNQLVGGIPTQLGNLGNLTEIWLHQNQLTGPIPLQLASLSNLKYLHLYSNQLIGTIPPQLGNLSQLKALYLNSNQLTGNIPAELGNLTELQALYLSDNQLTGSIPVQLGNLSNLQTLYLSTNQLTGNIPAQLGNLSNLTEIYLHQNQLSGSIPVEFGNLTKLVTLFVYTNQLSGNIPSQLGNLSDLLLLYLSDNQLEGTIPASIGNLTNLTTLYLNDNKLIGQLPASLGNLAQLGSIDLSNNLFSGALPATLSNLSQVVSFTFSDTGLCTPDDNAALVAWLADINALISNGLNCDQIPGPSLVAVPNAARAGAQIHVIGDRFQPQGPYDLTLAGLGAPVGSPTADAGGQFDVVISVPGNFAPSGNSVVLSAQANFEPVGTVQSTNVAWLSPLALSISPNQAQAGATVTATISNLYAGDLVLTFGSTIVAGPLAVASGQLILPFVVPAGETGSAITVDVLNMVNDLPFGSATTTFNAQAPSTFNFEEQPHATVEVDTDNPPPPWQSNGAILVTGSFPDIPAGQRDDVNIDVMFSDEDGRVFPLTAQPLPLDNQGNFNAQVRLPSLLAGDPLPTSAAGNFVINARLGDQVKTLIEPYLNESGVPPFAIQVVRAGTGNLDGTNIPDTPAGSLRLLYRAQGVAYADSDELESATFYNALNGALRSVYKDQIHDAINDVVQQYFECHPFIEQQEVQPWELAWRPPDEFELLGNQQIMPVVQIPNLVKQLNIGLAPAAAAVQPDAVANTDALVAVRFIYVLVDATEVKDGAIASNGYGPAESIQAKRKVAYGALYAVVPSTGVIYLVNGFDANNPQNSVAFERLPSGPVKIALQPYPNGTLPRLQFDVTVPGVNVLGISYPPNYNGPLRLFGLLYSFKNFAAPVTFGAGDLKIEALVNDGYAANQIPLSAIKMTLYPEGSNTGIPLEVKSEEFGADPCKATPRVRFIGTIKDGGRALAPGTHTITVEINDGLDNLKQRLLLYYVSPPAYFGGPGLRNRRVHWSPELTELSAIRFDSNDDTSVPGDLQVDPPKGPRPDNLHVDNQSGLDSSVLQTLTPSGPGEVRQTARSRATAWNRPLSVGANGVQAAGFPSLAAFSAAVARPPIPCNPNNPYEYCIGPKSFSLPEKEMLLFPPILWGLPGLADVKIAGTLAYLAGVETSGVAHATVPPDLTMQVWPYAQVRVAIDIAAELLGGLIGRLGVNTSANVKADVPVVFSTGGKNDTNACFRWFIEAIVYAQAGCIPLTDECLYEDEITRSTILDGREPHTAFCNGVNATTAAAASTVAPAALEELPPSGNPAIATDGIHMIALWNTTANELVYSHFDGNQWSTPVAVDAGRVAERAAVAYFDANRALAVWNGTTLTQPGGQSLDSAVAAQVLEYSIWNGTTWSEPARLAPQSKGDGGAVLASCPAGVAGCPATGEVTVAWTHIQDGALSNLHLRVYTSRYTNGAWSAPQAVDASSTSLDTAPMITYVGNQPVVGWVRDADASFATVDDRRIAIRDLAAAAIDLPQVLPTGAVAGSLAADSEGQLVVVYTRAADGALISNHQEIVAARQSCAAQCTWTANTLVDTHGRALQGEHPVLTVDGQNRATITYRATGFGPDEQGAMVYANDAPGITVGTGELAQLELNSQFAPANPHALTQDGVLNWEPAAVYNAGLNKIVAVSVRGAPNDVAASSVMAATSEQSVQALDDTIIFATSERQPDFVIESVAPSYASPTATLPSAVIVTIANLGIAPSGANPPLEVAIAWDTAPLAAQQVGTATIATVGGGATAAVNLPVPALNGAIETVHRLYITVNGKRAIAESAFANNETHLEVTGIPAPEQVFVTADPVEGLFHLQWEAPQRNTAIAGYRIYRRTDGGIWQPVGSSFGTAWADINATFDVSYEYAVTSYTVAGFESALSQSMKAIMSAQAGPELNSPIIFLPQVFKGVQP